MLSGIGFIGWARPTPVAPRNFRRPVADDILVSLAGPASNVLLIVIFGLMLKVYLSIEHPAQLDARVEPILYLLLTSVTINVVLAIFNLIPVPPLDGSHVIRHFLNGSALETYDRVGTYG
jgi:Zn-dependent protease